MEVTHLNLNKKMNKKLKFEVTRYPNRKHTMMYEMKKDKKAKARSKALDEFKKEANSKETAKKLGFK